MNKEKDKKSLFEKEDTYNRIFFGSGKVGCGLILAIIAIVFIVYNIIVHS